MIETDIWGKLIAEEALKWVSFPTIFYNRKYPNRGRTMEGFDCSGFVDFVLRECAIPIPEIATHNGRLFCNRIFDHLGLFLHSNARQPGDLVAFARDGFESNGKDLAWTDPAGGGRAPTHIGIMLDRNHYIHASGFPETRGETPRVRVSKLIFEELNHLYVGHLYDHNPIGFKRIVPLNGRYHKIQ